METEVSSPISQVPQLSLSWARYIQAITHILLPEDPSQYYPPIYVWVSQVVPFPPVSQQTPVHASPLLSLTHANSPPVSFPLHAPTVTIQQTPI